MTAKLPTPDKTLDVRGLQCPMPILKTKKEIEKLEKRQILEVLSSDAGSKEDFPRWAKRTGHELIAVHDEDGFTRFFIRRLV